MITHTKVCIVTGAAKGIGRAIAEELCKEGHTVIISDLNQKECAETAQLFEETYNTRCIGIACDMSKPEAIRALVKKTTTRFKQLDVFINNAGIYPRKNLERITQKDWDTLININLRGSFFAIQESSRAMKRGGRICITSSIAAQIGFTGLAHYCASKAGVNGLVRASALELAPRGITVNAVAPGATETPGTMTTMNKKEYTATAKAIPLGRWGLPQEVAHAVAFLVSDKASYITGHILTVDGGWTLQ